MKEVAELLAKYPDEREQLAKDLKHMFPGYEFLNGLDRTSPTPPSKVQ
jgi:hypothetical protein